MRVALEKNIENRISSFTVLELIESHFDPNWHFHPHYQLFTVIEGSGTRFIGDSIQHFEEGDTVFLGPNIPHLWRSDKPYFEHNSELKAHGIVVYFTEDFLGNDFFQKPEMVQLQHFLKNGLRGLEFNGDTRQYLIDELKGLTRSSGFEAIIKLLTILNNLSKSSEFEYITSLGYTNTHKISETERMQKVHEYVIKHFKEEIRLSEISEMVNMTESAFCRYFKNRTNKTFSDFVSEIRIGHACKLLSQDKQSIAQICFDSGFNTLSNFNKQFKEVVGKTPSEYQKLQMKS